MELAESTCYFTAGIVVSAVRNRVAKMVATIHNE